MDERKTNPTGNDLIDRIYQELEGELELRKDAGEKYLTSGDIEEIIVSGIKGAFGLDGKVPYDELKGSALFRRIWHIAVTPVFDSKLGPFNKNFSGIYRINPEKVAAEYAKDRKSFDEAVAGFNADIPI